MIRYTSFAGSIARITPLTNMGHPTGYSIVEAARVPAPVRAVFTEVHKCGNTEVDWDPKARAAKLVPYWERYRI
jgi:hypothetical protein